jgi:hypothetical protein
MRPEAKSSNFFLSSRIFSDIITVPSQCKIMLQRIDQEVKELCKIPRCQRNPCHGP